MGEQGSASVPRRVSRGITLLEMLVTMLVSGVILAGLGSLFVASAGSFAHWSNIRESRFSTGLLELELFWKLKMVPAEPYAPPAVQTGFRPAATFNDAVITFTDTRGLQTRDVLTYAYRTNLQGAFLSQMADTLMTGMIYQYFDTTSRRIEVYRFERPEAGDNFNAWSAPQLQMFVDDANNRAASLVLATGVDVVDFTLVSGSVQWTITQFE